MASPLNVTVTGRKALLRALRDIGDAAQSIVEEAVLLGTYTFRDEAHRRAPVGDGTKRPAGTLKGRIRVAVSKKKGRVEGRVVNPPEAVFTEYGFLHKRSGRRIPARPWARPAFDAKAPQVEKEALEFMARRLEMAAQRSAAPDA